MNLEDRAKESHENPNVRSKTLFDYLQSTQALWFWLTSIIIVIIPIVSLSFANIFPLIFVRWSFAVLLIFWLPGFILVKLLFPKKPEQRQSEEYLDPLERVAISIGLSMVFVPIVGLVLNYTPGGISLMPILFSLAALAMLLSFFALAREYQSLTKFSTMDEVDQT